MSDISEKPKWMVGEMSDCGNFRIDCALGVELKKIRINNDMTLMDMSKVMEFTPARLSNYEHKIGALTNPVDAYIIDKWCVDTMNLLPDSAIVLSHRSVRTDLTKAQELIANIRNSVGAGL